MIDYRELFIKRLVWNGKGYGFMFELCYGDEDAAEMSEEELAAYEEINAEAHKRYALWSLETYGPPAPFTAAYELLEQLGYNQKEKDDEQKS